MATIEGRLALLTALALDVLGVASVIGREFSAELVSASSRIGESAVVAELGHKVAAWALAHDVVGREALGLN